NLSPNIIVVKCSSVINIANDDSPLVYCCQYEMNSCSLIVLDTTTMGILSIKLLRPMDESTVEYYYIIVGVHGGEIIVGRKTVTKVGDKVEDTFEICKAKFPEALKHFEKAALAREKQKSEEDERRFAEVDQKMNSMNDEMNQMRLRIDELERENMELKDKLEESNGKYKKLIMMLRTMEKIIFRNFSYLILYPI
ncbi:hypothetical protein PFISCL1PPCAC_9175, partial [Pristionchus fissidentatus]